MSCRDGERLRDILDAIDAIRSHVARGGLSDGLVFDAVRVRLIEIGEAIKAISPELLDTEPDHPWSDIARMRDRLAHRYFDTNHGHVTGAVEHDLEPLEAAVLRLQDRLPLGEWRRVYEQRSGPAATIGNGSRWSLLPPMPESRTISWSCGCCATRSVCRAATAAPARSRCSVGARSRAR